MKKKNWIVEDNRDLREAMAMMIQFTDQFELAGTLKMQKPQCVPTIAIDALLMDVNLPGRNGYECVSILKPKT
jgi:DNA-binding NarL/FixJ family response regulator